MRRAAAASVLAAALPMAALADCPTRKDLGGGVTLTRHDPFLQSRFVETAGGILETRSVGTGPEAVDVSARYLHGLVSTEFDGPGGLFQMAVFEDPADVDRLPEIGRWESLVHVAWDGEFRGEGVLTLIYIETVPLEFEACAYDTWYVQSTIDVDTLDPIFNDFYYAPDLGLVLLSVVVTEKGEAVSNVFFDRVQAD